MLQPLGAVGVGPGRRPQQHLRPQGGDGLGLGFSVSVSVRVRVRVRVRVGLEEVLGTAFRCIHCVDTQCTWVRVRALVLVLVLGYTNLDGRVSRLRGVASGHVALVETALGPCE